MVIAVLIDNIYPALLIVPTGDAAAGGCLSHRGDI